MNTPIWKKFLAYVDYWNKTQHPYVDIKDPKNPMVVNGIYPSYVVEWAGIVETVKAFHDVLYRLKKKGYVSYTHAKSLDIFNQGEKAYCIVITEAGYEALGIERYSIEMLKDDQPKKNEEAFAIDIDGKTVFSLSMSQAKEMFGAIKTFCKVLNEAIMKD